MPSDRLVVGDQKPVVGSPLVRLLRVARTTRGAPCRLRDHVDDKGWSAARAVRPVPSSQPIGNTASTVNPPDWGEQVRTLGLRLRAEPRLLPAQTVARPSGRGHYGATTGPLRGRSAGRGGQHVRGDDAAEGWDRPAASSGPRCSEVFVEEAEEFLHVLLTLGNAGDTIEGVPHAFPNVQVDVRACVVQLPGEAHAVGWARSRVPVVRMVGTKPSL
jgi:hypothetical protein